MKTFDEVLAAALELTPDEREAMATELYCSVEKEEGYDEAWAAEIKRRIDDIDSGRAKLIPGDEVMAELRARLEDAARLPVSS